MKVAVVMPCAFEFYFMSYTKHGKDTFANNNRFIKEVSSKESSMQIGWVNALLNSGFDVTFYHLSLYGKDVVSYKHITGSNIKSIPCNFSTNKYPWQYSFDLLREIEKDSNEVIFSVNYFSNNNFFDMYDILTLYFKFKGKKVIARSSGENSLLGIYRTIRRFKNFKSSSFKKRFLYLLLPIIYGSTLLRLYTKKYIYNLSDFILVQTIQEKLMLENFFNVNAKNCAVINRAVSTPHYKFGRLDKSECRDILGLHSDKKYILFVGNLYEPKGSEKTVLAMPELIEYYKGNIEFLIIGEGPQKAKLEKLARLNGSEKYVKFLGHITRSDLVFYYAACDVLPYVYHLKKNAYDAVPIEAIMSNVPIIVGSGLANSEFIEGGTGLSVSLTNINELITAIKSILDGKFIMDQKARHKIIKTYDEKALVNNLKNLIEGLK